MVVTHSYFGLRCSLLMTCCVLWIRLTHGKGFIRLPAFCGLIPCLSSDNAFNTCELGDEITIKNVTILYRVSDADCTYFDGIPEDYNGIGGVYGYSNNALWVNHGCRAYFRFCYTPGPSHMCGLMSCFSWNYAFKSCVQRAGIRIQSVSILSRLSDSECAFFGGLPKDYSGVRGVYGFNNNVLWVDHGCRAHFSFCYLETTQTVLSGASPSVTSTSTVLHRTSATSGTSTRLSVWTAQAVTSVASLSSHTSHEIAAQSRTTEKPSILSSSSLKTSSLSTSTSLSTTIPPTVTLNFSEFVTPMGRSKESSESNVPITIMQISASPTASSISSLKPTFHTTVMELSAASTTNAKHSSKFTIRSFMTEVPTSASTISRESSKLTTHTAITESRTSSAATKPTSYVHTMRSTFGNLLFVSNVTSTDSEATILPSSSNQTVSPTTFITTSTEGLLIPRNDTQTQNDNGTDSDDVATVILLTSVLAFLALVMLVLVGTFLWRKRRAKRFQGQILQPDDDIL